MSYLTRFTIVFIFVCALAFLYGCDDSNSVSGPEKKNFSSSDVVPLAQCLSEKGAILYGADWCPHTVRQKEAFGDGFVYINYVECTKNETLCVEAEIEHSPTWIINEIKIWGFYELDTLAKVASCD